MIQGRDGLGFALKTLAELGGGRFDRHIAIQPRIFSPVNLPHAAGPDALEDPVPAHQEVTRVGHRVAGLADARGYDFLMAAKPRRSPTLLNRNA